MSEEINYTGHTAKVVANYVSKLYWYLVAIRLDWLQYNIQIQYENSS